MGSVLYSFAGLLAILAVWYGICLSGLIPVLLLPYPHDVILALPEMFNNDHLITNMWYSVYLNFMGYFVAVLASLPIGFLLGLNQVVRKMFARYLDSIRYLPLTAMVGLFIAWFGIGSEMKIAFLGFGIFVYLLPTVIQRIDELDKVYVDTVYTLGASRWQTIRTVYIPSVLGRISDDIRVLVAISWTYLIVAELVNKGSGGLGALAYTAGRQSRVDKVFAVLLVIILIGILQDRLFQLLDRVLFPYKHVKKK